MRCSPEEKQHMIDLIIEMRQIVNGMPALPGKEKLKVVNRLNEIQTEMKVFRKRYPLD